VTRVVFRSVLSDVTYWTFTIIVVYNHNQKQTNKVNT